MGKGELRRVGLAGFLELDKAGMNGIGMMLTIEGWVQVLSAEVASKGSNINNQVRVIKPGFQGVGEFLGEKRDLRDGERLRLGVNNRVNWGVMIGVNVGGES